LRFKIWSIKKQFILRCISGGFDLKSLTLGSASVKYQNPAPIAVHKHVILFTQRQQQPIPLSKGHFFFAQLNFSLVQTNRQLKGTITGKNQSLVLYARVEKNKKWKETIHRWFHY
jgi:hypothetical protein